MCVPETKATFASLTGDHVCNTVYLASSLLSVFMTDSKCNSGVHCFHAAPPQGQVCLCLD